jgi:hypothetical protein
MKHETAIAAAFKKADATTSHMQAYTLAAKLLRGAGGKFDAAPLVLKKFLDAIAADENLMRGCALGFLQFVAGDMKGGAAGHSLVDTHTSSASAPPARDGSDHSLRDTHTGFVAPVREPSTTQKQAAAAIKRLMAESVLTSMRIRDGRAIGKVYRSELSNLIGENWRETAIFDRVRKIPIPDGRNDARIDEYVSDVQLKRIVAEVDRAVAA